MLKNILVMVKLNIFPIPIMPILLQIGCYFQALFYVQLQNKKIAEDLIRFDKRVKNQN